MIRGRLFANDKLAGHNLVTNTYRERHARWLVGQEIPVPLAIAVGTGTSYPRLTDIGLENEYYRKAITGKWVIGLYTAKFFLALYPYDPPFAPGVSSMTFTEIGIFTGNIRSVINPDFEGWEGSPEVLTGWSKTGDGSAWEKDDVNKYEGDYSLKVTYGSEPVLISIDFPDYEEIKGIQVKLLLAIKSSVADQARVSLNDGISISYSDYHTGDGEFQIISIVKLISASATMCRLGLHIEKNGSPVNFDWTRFYETGNLWSRGIIDITKDLTEAKNISWEITAEEEEVAYQAYDNEEISQGTVSAGSLDPSKYAPAGATKAQEAFITIEDWPLRCWYNSGSPSISSGHQFAPGKSLSFIGEDNIANLKFIGIGGTSKLKVTFSR